MQTGKVFFDMVMSLDGFIAPEGMELAHIHDPEYKQWTKKWMTLMHWIPRRMMLDVCGQCNVSKKIDVICDVFWKWIADCMLEESKIEEVFFFARW